LLDFYLATAASVYAIERPGDRLIDHLEPTTYLGLSFQDRQGALDWLYAEAHCLLACARQSFTGVRLRRAVDLLCAAKDLGESGANSKLYEATAVAARDKARSAGDGHAEARARTALTNVHLVAGRYLEADVEAIAASELAAAARDGFLVYWTDNDRGIVAASQGRYEEAERHLHRAIDGARTLGNLPGAASALCNLSRVNTLLGRRGAAIELAQQGVAIYDALGLTVRLANSLYALGIALTGADRPGEALEQLNRALDIFAKERQRLWEGTAHFRIAQVHLSARRPAQAARHAEQALANGCVGGDRTRAGALTTLGEALDQLGQLDRARACWQEALSLFEQSGAPDVDRVRALLTPAAAA
ncbi:tetratricopeptide repeat protein, partial [Streptomyces sp. NPDC001941]|uniref:tetratricopeptide repeat protein n=1 Tax=Streptomyces sp. NPDC001941 TaxID=3154659 RepID=UPI00332D7F92